MRIVSLGLTLFFASCAASKGGPPPGCQKPECAEFFEGIPALDPNADDDNDGIKNADDKAPTLPEDRDGTEDEDGVPDPDPVAETAPAAGANGETTTLASASAAGNVSDVDKDGIADAYDQCLNEAEDKDDFQDEDGCPELDNDKDGTPDGSDPCPNLPGTSCVAEKPKPTPAAAPTAAPAGPRKLEINDQLFFGAGSAKLDVKKSKAALDALYAAMAEDPALRIEIKGHTDNKGKEASNKKLSKARAFAVKMFLVKKKIKGDRMVATGMGSEEPLESNDTKEGREANRRVEFEVIP